MDSWCKFSIFSLLTILVLITIPNTGFGDCRLFYISNSDCSYFYYVPSGPGYAAALCTINKKPVESYRNYQYTQCSETYASGKANACPPISHSYFNGKPCYIHKDCFVGYCTYKEYEGRWSASTKECVKCEGRMKRYVYGNAEKICVDCSGNILCYHGTYVCESACGAPSECDDKKPGDPIPGGYCDSNCNPVLTCDSSSYNSCSSAYNFGSTSGTKTDMCGADQYYKVSTPPGKKCDIKWTVTPDGNADYDLYVKWSSVCPSTSNYDCISRAGTGRQDSCSKNEHIGETYALVHKYGGSGAYTVSVSISNCVDVVTTTTSSTTTSTTTIPDCRKCEIRNLQCPSTVNPGEDFNIKFEFYGTGPTYKYEHRSLWLGGNRIGCHYGVDHPDCQWHLDSFVVTAPSTPGTYTYTVKCYGYSSSSESYCSPTYQDDYKSCTVTVRETTTTTSTTSTTTTIPEDDPCDNSGTWKKYGIYCCEGGDCSNDESKVRGVCIDKSTYEQNKDKFDLVRAGSNEHCVKCKNSDCCHEFRSFCFDYSSSSPTGCIGRRGIVTSTCADKNGNTCDLLSALKGCDLKEEMSKLGQLYCAFCRNPPTTTTTQPTTSTTTTQPTTSTTTTTIPEDDPCDNSGTWKKASIYCYEGDVREENKRGFCLDKSVAEQRSDLEIVRYGAQQHCVKCKANSCCFDLRSFCFEYNATEPTGCSYPGSVTSRCGDEGGNVCSHPSQVGENCVIKENKDKLGLWYCYACPSAKKIECEECYARSECKCELKTTCDNGFWILQNQQGKPLDSMVNSPIPPYQIDFEPNSSGKILITAICFKNTQPQTFQHILEVKEPFLECDEDCRTREPCECRVNGCEDGWFSAVLGTTLLKWKEKINKTRFKTSFISEKPGVVEVTVQCISPQTYEEKQVVVGGTIPTRKFQAFNFRAEKQDNTIKIKLDYSNNLAEDVVIVFTLSKEGKTINKKYTAMIGDGTASLSLDCTDIGRGTYSVTWKAFKSSDVVNPIAWSKPGEMVSVTC
ncbi:MAG: hypothetical protein QW228_02330 [Candidatus Aenigmatarchaeota archaeon]